MGLLMKNKKEETDLKVQSANEFVNVKDIKNGILYTKDSYVFAYIRVQPIALELISENEKKMLARQLSVELSAEQKPFKNLSISRPVNISGLIDDLTEAYMLAETPQQKEILKEEINTINEFALSGDVVERQYYYIIWEKYYDGVEEDIKRRAIDFCNKLSTVQHDVRVLNDSEIVQLCNLFANPGYSHYEDGTTIPSIPMIIGGIAG